MSESVEVDVVVEVEVVVDVGLESELRDVVEDISASPPEVEADEEALGETSDAGPPEGVGASEAVDPPADAEAGSVTSCRASASGVIVGGFGEVPNCRQRSS